MHADATLNAIWILLLKIQEKKSKVNLKYDKGVQAVKHKWDTCGRDHLATFSENI